MLKLDCCLASTSLVNHKPIAGCMCGANMVGMAGKLPCLLHCVACCCVALMDACAHMSTLGPVVLVGQVAMMQAVLYVFEHGMHGYEEALGGGANQLDGQHASCILCQQSYPVPHPVCVPGTQGPYCTNTHNASSPCTPRVQSATQIMPCSRAVGGTLVMCCGRSMCHVSSADTLVFCRSTSLLVNSLHGFGTVHEYVAGTSAGGCFSLSDRSSKRSGHLEYTHSTW